MLFFKPGVYEEFVFKLSSLRVSPPEQVWNVIIQRQEALRAERRSVIIRRLSVAATILVILGLGAFSYQIVTINSNPIVSSVDLSSENSQLKFTSLFDQLFLESPMPRSYSYIVLDQKMDAEVIADVETKIDESERDKESGVLTSKTGVVKRNGDKHKTSSNLPLLTPKKQTLKKGEVDKPSQLTLAREKYNPWTISFSLYPAYSYHTFGFSNLTPYSNERGAWMISGEILVKKRITRNFSFHSGLTLEPFGQNIENIILLTSNKVNKDMQILVASTAYGWVSLENQFFGVINSSDFSNTPGNIIKTAAVNQASLSQKFYYLDIPFMFSYSMFSRYTEIEVKLGGSAGILIGNRFELTGNNKKFIGKTEGVSPYNFSLNAGICLSRPIVNNLNLLVEPNLRIGLRPLILNETLTYPFSTSVKVGVSYKF